MSQPFSPAFLTTRKITQPVADNETGSPNTREYRIQEDYPNTVRLVEVESVVNQHQREAKFVRSPVVARSPDRATSIDRRSPGTRMAIDGQGRPSVSPSGTVRRPCHNEVAVLSDSTGGKRSLLDRIGLW